MKLRYKKQRKLSYCCVGGPWDCSMVLLPHETMVFSVGDQLGKYVKGYWQNV